MCSYDCLASTPASKPAPVRICLPNFAVSQNLSDLTAPLIADVILVASAALSNILPALLKPFKTRVALAPKFAVYNACALLAKPPVPTVAAVNANSVNAAPATKLNPFVN